MLNALTHAISPMHTTVTTVYLPLRRANTHDALLLVFAEPCFLRLSQYSFTNVVEEMADYNECECDRIQPVDMQMEDVKSNEHSLLNVSMKV
jgi:hypothetical protein